MTTTQAQLDTLIEATQIIDDVANGPYGTVTNAQGEIVTVTKAITDMTAFNPRGAWVTSTAYEFKDLVTESGIVYVVVVDHTSNVFATDLSNGLLAVYQNIGNEYGSISEMKGGSGGILDGQVASALGYYAKTENQKWSFRWDATSTATEIAGVVVPLSPDSGTGRWVRLYSDLNADFFGFEASQTAAVNTAAFKAAIEFAGAGISSPNKLILPAGNFQLNEIDFETMTISGGLIIQGQGWGNNPKTGTYLIFEGASTYSINTTSVEYVQLRDFALDGSGVAGTFMFFSNYGEMHNIRSKGHLKYDCRHSGIVSAIDGCSFSASSNDGTGAACLMEYNANRITNTYMNGGGNAPALIVQESASPVQTDSGTVSQCTFESGDPYEVKILDGVKSLSLIDNYFEGNLATSGTILVDTGLHESLNISNNRVSQSSGLAPSIHINEVNKSSSMVIKNNWLSRSMWMDLEGHTGEAAIKTDDIPICDISLNYCIRNDRAIILNGLYNLDYIRCTKTYDAVVGAIGRSKIELGTTFLDTDGVTPGELIQFYVPDTGGGTFARGLKVTSKVRWREDATGSGNSNELNYYEDVALAFNDASTLALLQTSIVSLEGNALPTVLWSASTAAIGQLTLDVVGKSGTNVWYGDFEILNYQ